MRLLAPLAEVFAAVAAIGAWPPAYRAQTTVLGLQPSAGCLRLSLCPEGVVLALSAWRLSYRFER